MKTTTILVILHNLSCQNIYIDRFGVSLWLCPGEFFGYFCGEGIAETIQQQCCDWLPLKSLTQFQWSFLQSTVAERQFYHLYCTTVR